MPGADARGGEGGEGEVLHPNEFFLSAERALEELEK